MRKLPFGNVWSTNGLTPGGSFRLILPFESDDPIDETASEAEMARWLIGAGPEEDLMIPHAPETNEAEMVRRSGTPMPSSGATAFNDLYA